MRKLIIILVLLLLVGCSKKSLTTKEFKKIMRDNNYYVVSVKKQFSEYDYIEEALLARKDNINIEYYLMSDVENTDAFYDYNKDVIEAYKTKYDTDKESKNKYLLETDEKYMVISCISNTCIYVDTDVENKRSVNDILKKLGY